MRSTFTLLRPAAANTFSATWTSAALCERLLATSSSFSKLCTPMLALLTPPAREAVTFCEQPNLVADGVDVALPDILGAVCSDDKVAEMTLLHTEGHMDVDGGLLGTEYLLRRHGFIFEWIGMNRLASLQHR